MKAVVFHGIGDIRLDDVPEPKIKEPMDAIVRLTKSAICGTDLHMIRGTFTGMKPGTILGHEGIGEAGKIKTVIDRTYPLSEIADAHAYSETEHAAGKIAIAMVREA